MASSGILFFIFTALCITAVKSGFVDVKCKAKSVGHYGQQSLLECVVQTSKDVTDPVIRVVAWKKLSSPEDEDGRVMLAYDRGESKTTSGYRFAEPSWNKKNMNVSLLITNTTVTDKGLYSCMVITDSGDHTNFITLNVQAKYSAPTIRSIPEKIVQNTDSALICESDGGYPEGKLRWFDEQNNEWPESSEPVVKQTPNGLFQLRSTFKLLRGSTFSRYTCVVFNASGGKEDEITFDISPSPSENTGNFSAETSKIVAPLLVIGSLIVGLLFALLFYRRRTQKARRDSAAPLMDQHHGVPTTERDIEAGGDQSHEKESQS